jgi:hypothetical protein
MTFDEAYAHLRARWPRQTFSIGHQVWHHHHSDSIGGATRTEEYAVYTETGRMHYYGPTLANAVEQALGELHQVAP